MSDNSNTTNNKLIFHFNSILEMCENMSLCKSFYTLTKKDDSYDDIMAELDSLSSCDMEIFETFSFSESEISPTLSNLVKYVFMSQSSYNSLVSEDNSSTAFVNQTINLNKYGSQARRILKCLKTDDASYTTADRLLTPMYPMQDKIILFNKELIQKCIEGFTSGEKPEKNYHSQMTFKRLLDKLGLSTIEKALFPECTEESKTFNIPICSLPAITFVFIVYHHPELPYEIRFSILSDSFINIAIAKGLNLPAILKLLHNFKKNFEKNKIKLGQDNNGQFLDFLQNPRAYTAPSSLSAQDSYFVYSLMYDEYTKLEEHYYPLLHKMEVYRQIETGVLDALAEWFKNPKNLINFKKTNALADKENTPNAYAKVSSKELLQFLKQTKDFDTEYLNPEEALDRFLEMFQFSKRQYNPIPSEELFDILNKLTILDIPMFNILKCLTYHPDVRNSQDQLNREDFFTFGKQRKQKN